jgi:DNA-binding NarL/FixJ family response regulator
MMRVLIVDDHALVRDGLVNLLRGADFDVVAQAANGEEAVRLAAEHHPDIVLMDLSMPVLDGIEATRRIVASGTPTRIVALTSFSDRDRILAAVAAGCYGYLLKDSEPEELLRGIRAAAAGGAPFDPRVAGTLLQSFSTPATATPQLTPREQEVLQLVARGMANKEIARRLGITEKTVKAHLTSVFQRIGVEDRTQAALWAHDHGAS